MSNYKVEISGVDTRNLKVLTSEEMTELFKNIKTNPFARNDLVEGNLKLVLSILKRFKNYNENLDDLFQVGCIGLVKSIDNFDLEQNVKFSTYAVPMIIGEIRRYLRDNNSIRVSRSVRDLAYKAMQFKEKYIRENGKEPTIDVIAKELKVEREEIAYSFDAIQDPISLQEPIYNDGAESIYIMDQVKDSKNTDELWIESMTINQIMKKLNDKEKMIITKRFFDGRTQMEVAEEIGISQAQVSRLEKNAIEHIKRLYK